MENSRSGPAALDAVLPGLSRDIRSLAETHGRSQHLLEQFATTLDAVRAPGAPSTSSAPYGDGVRPGPQPGAPTGMPTGMPPAAPHGQRPVGAAAAPPLPPSAADERLAPRRHLGGEPAEQPAPGTLPASRPASPAHGPHASAPTGQRPPTPAQGPTQDPTQRTAPQPGGAPTAGRHGGPVQPSRHGEGRPTGPAPQQTPQPLRPVPGPDGHSASGTDTRRTTPSGPRPADGQSAPQRKQRSGADYDQPWTPVPEEERWWTKEGAVTRVLGISGGLLTAAGMAFFLAIVFSLVGPFGQLAIAIGVGALFGAGGWWLHTRHVAKVRERTPGAGKNVVGTHIGALATLGTSIAIFLIIPVAASAVYDLLHPAIGLALVFVVAAVGVWIARKLESAVMAGIGVCGAMIAMIIVEQNALTLGAIALMYVISGFVTTGLGKWLRLARAVTYIGTSLAMYAVLTYQLEEGSGAALSTGTWVYIAIVAVTAACAMIIGIREVSGETTDALITGCVGLAPTLLVPTYIFHTDPMETPFFFVGLGIVYVVTGTIAQIDDKNARRETTIYARVAMSIGTAMLSIGLFWSAAELDIDLGYSVLGSAFVAFCYLTLHLRLRSLYSLVQAGIVSAIPLACTIPAILDSRLWFLPDERVSAPALVLVQLAAASAILAFAIVVLLRTIDDIDLPLERPLGPNTRAGTEGPGHLPPPTFDARSRNLVSSWPWALLSLAWIVSTILYGGLMLTSTPAHNEVWFYFGHLFVTVGLFAVSIWLLTTKKPLPQAKAFGALLFLASMAKLLAIDLSNMSAIVRILVFCVVGIMMLATATVMSNRADDEKTPAEHPAPFPGGPGGAGARNVGNTQNVQAPYAPSARPFPAPSTPPVLHEQRARQHAQPASEYGAAAHGPAADRARGPEADGPGPQAPRG